MGQQGHPRVFVDIYPAGSSASPAGQYARKPAPASPSLCGRARADTGGWTRRCPVSSWPPTRKSPAEASNGRELRELIEAEGREA